MLANQIPSCGREVPARTLVRAATRAVLGPRIVADCAWTCKRRMGIGDKVVVVGALQALQAAGFDVAARWWWSAWDDADDWLFKASGIPQFDPYAAGADGRSLLDLRGHCMEIPIGNTQEDADAADLRAPHPVWRVLWNHGLEEYALPTPRVRLKPRPRHPIDAPLWFPLEVSRGGNPISAEAWEAALLDLCKRRGRVHVCCAAREWCAVAGIVSRLSEWTRRTCLYGGFVSPGGPDALLSAVAAAPEILCGNSGPMWLAIATDTPCTVLQRPPTGPHSTMWQASPRWSPTLRVVTV